MLKLLTRLWVVKQLLETFFAKDFVVLVNPPLQFLLDLSMDLLVAIVSVVYIWAGLSLFILKFEVHYGRLPYHPAYLST